MHLQPIFFKPVTDIMNLNLQQVHLHRSLPPCVVCRPHTWPSAIAIPSNILSHRKVPFQKMSPPPRENP
jgi:hypothetical protein